MISFSFTCSFQSTQSDLRFIYVRCNKVSKGILMNTHNKTLSWKNDKYELQQVCMWNSLDSSVRDIDSFKRFKNTLKTSLFPKIPTSLSKGNRYLSVIHCRIRNGCSNLNNDLFRNHLNVSPLCSCGNGNETADHFFFECPLFNDQRLTFFQKNKMLSSTQFTRTFVRQRQP